MNLKIALVHDYLNQMGGAERVLIALHELFPAAPIFTSIYEPALVAPEFRDMDIHVSFMQHLPGIMHHHQPFLPLYPYAFEMFDLNNFDLVISNSSAFAKGVITRPEQLHICYCLTPMRWAWNYQEYVKRENLGSITRAILPFYLHNLRQWDTISADRVDHFIGISNAVSARIKKYYRRTEVAVIYPPVEIPPASHSPAVEDFFLIVSRLIPYKRIDLAVEAFNQVGLPLKIIGAGRDLENLRQHAKANIEFLGRLPDHAVHDYYSRCRALIFPGEEDFGIVPLEVQARGRPVIAYKAGGALDTVIPGVSGEYFTEQTPEALAAAVRDFDETYYNPEAIRRHAERFSSSHFKQQLTRYIQDKLLQHQLPSLSALATP